MNKRKPNLTLALARKELYSKAQHDLENEIGSFYLDHSAEEITENLHDCLSAFIRTPGLKLDSHDVQNVIHSGFNVINFIVRLQSIYDRLILNEDEEGGQDDD